MIEGNASDPNSDNEFYYNNGQPFSTGDKESNAGGSECAIGYAQFG